MNGITVTQESPFEGPVEAPQYQKWLSACRSLILQSEPWITLRYGEKEVQGIARTAAQGRVWIARDGDLITGFLLSTSGFLLGEYIRILVIHPEYRSKGVGAKLLAEFERSALERCSNVYLCVSSFNEAGQAFYQKHGYEEIGRLKNLLREGYDEILMRKTRGPHLKES